MNRDIEENPDGHNRSPFREHLTDSPANPDSNLQEMEKDPEKILRSEPILGFARKLESYLEVVNNPGENDNILEKAVAGANKANKMLGELKDVYGIDMPLLGFVVGQDESGRQMVYTVAEKIHGENLLNRELIAEERTAIEAGLCKIYTSLLSYFETKYRANEPFLSDIARNRQFMIGNTARDKSEKIYMVDVEAYPEAGRELLLGEIKILAKEANDLKKKFDLNLDEFEKELSRFLLEISAK